MILTVTKPTTVNTGVLPEAFREALQVDLAAQRDAAPMEASQWLVLRDGVRVCTQQMRLHGYYPERVLVAIKSAVCDAAVPLVAQDLVNEIVHDAAQWCIAPYFELEADRAGTVAIAGLPVRFAPSARTPGDIHPELDASITL